MARIADDGGVAMTSPLDALVDLGAERVLFSVDFVLRPNAWAAHQDHWGLRWSKRRRWNPRSNVRIPRSPGLYAFSLIPDASGVPPSEYVLYVGKAETQTLAERYRQYVREAAGSGTRIHIYNMFKRWGDQLWYRCALVPAADVDDAERSVRAALEPPMNRDFSVDLNAAARAFGRL
jgi:hypothetical protein